MATARQATLEATHDCSAVEQADVEQTCVEQTCVEQTCVEQTGTPIQRAVSTARVTGDRIMTAIHHWLDLHKIDLLRISMGAVIFGFGILKYFPHVSPAEDLVLATIDILPLGFIPDHVVMVLMATVECIIGLSLMIGRGLRVIRYLLVALVISILSPAVLLAERLFMGPHNAPTLEGQYVLKDVILLTASLVIATTLSYGKKDGADQPAPTPDEDR